MKSWAYILAFLPIILTGCSAYQQALKSKDPELKYEMAMDYFNKEQYVKSQTLLEDVAPYYKGTDRAQDVLIYLSRSYMGQKDYESAADYFQAYIRNYPKGKYVIELDADDLIDKTMLECLYFSLEGLKTVCLCYNIISVKQ